MNDTAVIDNNNVEQVDETAEELRKRRKEQNELQKEQDELQEKQKKRSRINIITIVVLVLLIIVMAIIKYIIYICPERVKYDKNVESVASVNPDTSQMQVMPFNDDLVVACQPIIIADSRNKTAIVDFISPDSCKVLVRAEIFTAKNNVKKRSFRMFWTNFLHPKDESMVRLGATGWIRPGEMISKIKLDELPIRMSDVTVRFSAVNPANTKISAGIFKMETVMHVVDYKGKMLDENGNWVDAG